MRGREACPRLTGALAPGSLKPSCHYKVNRIPKKPLSEIDVSTLAQFVLTSEDEKDLVRGIELFNSGKFWEAHEAWEAIWLKHPEDGRFFIQGLIQLAAGYHQLGKKIYRGLLIHLHQAEERLRLFPSDFLGINVSALLSVIRGSLRELESQPSFESVDFDKLEIARIERA